MLVLSLHFSGGLLLIKTWSGLIIFIIVHRGLSVMPGMLFRGWLAIRYYKMNGLGKQNSAAHDSGRESETLCYVGRKKKK
jgi:hypothetical protein